MMRAVLLLLLLAGSAAQAGGRVEVCFNYGCASEAVVLIESEGMERIRGKLEQADGPAAEREAMSRAVGALYRMVGRHTPILSDRAGNLMDGGDEGRMDCIDHSTTTTRLLRLVEARGWLRFHRVREPARRTRLIFQHFAALIEEIEPSGPRRVEPEPADVPDYVPVLLALCDCDGVLGDLAQPAPVEWAPPFEPGARFVVDSWFVEHGEPAVILPLANWLNGEGPNVQ